MIMTLKELSIGDMFTNLSNPYIRYIVVGNPVCNLYYGSVTRMCRKVNSKVSVSKSCRVKVEVKNKKYD